MSTLMAPESARGGRRRWRRAGGASAALALLAALLVGSPAAPASAAPATVVSLTFDDGNADQMTAVPILQQYAMHGTFYIITGSVGAPNYVTPANLATINGNGNEIGGHTVTHPDLTTVPIDEAERQICNSRVTLAGWGYPTTSFAYPYAASNAAVESVVANCGFNSARMLGDIASAHGCAGCAVAGTIPPADPDNLAAVDEIDNTWTLAQLESVVTMAEAVGGWVPFTFHHICAGTGCDSLSISPTLFTSFVSWLSTRPSTTSVKTVGQVIGGTVKPLVSGPPATSTTAVTNPSLETPAGSGFPQCWMPGGYGINTAVWTASSVAHTGSVAERLAVSGYSSGDAKLLPTFDLGSCSPAVTAGATYTLSAWYQSSAVTQFALYYRDSSGAWYYWTSSPWFAAATAYTQASWTTPAAPAGATGISFGLNLFANASLTTDDYAIAPTVAGAAVVARAAAAATTKIPIVTPPRVTTGPSIGRPHHPNWSARSRPTVLGGKTLRGGQRISVPFLPD
jgi:peptidoglycan/xylan/chitin deacetylase (PgdA/CDA1 family)